MKWDRRTAAEWIPALWAAVVSSLLFFSGVFAFVFAVPVQTLLVRSGRRDAIRAASAFFALLVVGRLGQMVALGGVNLDVVRLLLLDTLLPTGVVVALIAYDWTRPYLSWSLRLPAAGLVALLFGAPVIWEIVSPDRLGAALSGDVSGALAAIGLSADGEWLSTQLSLVISRTVGFGMCTAVAINWWFGTNLGRVRSGRQPIISLDRVFVDQRLIWAVIGGFGLVVLSWVTGRDGVIPAVGWNVALTSAFLFGVQGLGIVQRILLRRGFPAARIRWTLTVAVILAFIPGINMIVIGGLPLVGLSELWVNYRRRDE
jgi:hypothetical protein